MSIKDTDKAFSSLRAFSQSNESVNLVVEALSEEDAVSWFNMYYTLSTSQKLDILERSYVKIIKCSEEALKNDYEEESIYHILYCLAFSLNNIKNPFSYCIKTELLPEIIDLIDIDSSNRVIFKICEILKIFCDDVKHNEKYGDNALALQFALDPLIYFTTQADVTESTAAIMECLKTTMEFVGLKSMTKKEIMLLFELYVFTIVDKDEDIADKGFQGLSFLTSNFSNFIIPYFNEKVLDVLVKALDIENANIVMNAAMVLSYLCCEKNLVSFFFDSMLPDKLLEKISLYVSKNLIAPIGPLFECYLALAETEHSLISMFFESPLFVGGMLVDKSTNINISILDLACSALEFSPESPPFLSDLDQIIHIATQCLDVSEDDVLIDALKIVSRLASEGVEMPPIDDQLEELVESKNKEISDLALEIIKKIGSTE